MKTEPTKLFF